MPEPPRSAEISSEPTLAVPETQPPRDVDELEPGSRLGEYQIISRLGRGGMGIVYRARHLTLDRLAALKVLSGGTENPRFLREARSAALLDHHNIVAVRHAGELQGRCFLEMELVEGRSLGELGGGGPLEPGLATRLVEQVAHALHHAHGRGIIHRDIKPDNILVSEDGVAKVTDFGLARPTVIESSLTAPGSILGTPAYMAPEQWQGTPADARTDLYALGATYFHILAGRPPFGGKLADLLRQHTESPPPDLQAINPAVPGEISVIVQRLLAKKAEDRYQSAAELIGDLRRAQRSGEEVAAGATPAAVTAPAAEQSEPAPEPITVSPSRSRQVLVTVLLWAGLCAALLAGERTQGWLLFERQLEDGRLVRRGPPLPVGVQLVLADDEFAARFGIPFNRQVLADLLEGLERAGARQVALDLLISDGGPPEDDAVLAASMAASRTAILCMDLQRGIPGREPRAVKLPARLAAPVPADGLPRATRATVPLAPLLEAASHVGTVGVEVEGDGVVRRIPLLTAYGDSVYPALSLLAAAGARDAGPRDLRWRSGELRVEPRGQDALPIAVEDGAMLRLSARGRLADRHPISLLTITDLLRSGTPNAARRLRELVGGKIVLIGVSLTGAADVQPLPGEPAAPLVLAHAMAIETILSGDFVRSAGPVMRGLLVAGAALLAVSAGLLLRLWIALALLPLLALLLWLAGGLVLARTGLLLPVAAPLLAIAGGGLLGGLQRAALAQSQRRRALDALGRYLPRRVAERVLADPRALRLGGQRKELTLLSVELQGFAALSERLEPEEVGQVLARLFAVVTGRVQESGGTVDRFSGEGVTAFFGDPLPLADHAARAVSCALQIRDEGLRVLARWAGVGRPRPPLGIGVHTGYVTVGNIGTLQRMEYTVLGRNLEVARRLSGSARDGVQVSSRTRSAAGDGFLYEARRGAGGAGEAPTEIFEVCGTR